MSWLAKANVSWEDRRLLGYHAPQGHESTLVYSRDAMSGPLRSLVKVMQDIRTGVFVPDVGRGKMFEADDGPSAAPMHPARGSQPSVSRFDESSEEESLRRLLSPLPAHGLVHDSSDDGFGPGIPKTDSVQLSAHSSSSSSSSVSSSGCTDSDSSAVANTEAAAQVVGVRGKASADMELLERFDLYIHKKYSTLHLMNKKSDLCSSFKCGRVLHLNHEYLHSFPAARFSRCSKCFYGL